MDIYRGDINWLLNHATKGKGGLYYCIYDDEKIVFESVEVETISPQGKKFIDRPYCPVCDPKKTRLKSSEKINNNAIRVDSTIS